MKAIEVYQGSDGEVTRAFYEDLYEHGAIGAVAVNLFRAQKCSARAKVYRGGLRGKGRFKDMAYERKNWSLDNLCKALLEHGVALGITFGWKQDPAQEFHSWVLYVDLPHGQVSFHSAARGDGPDYTGDWDGQHKSAERIIAFCDSVMSACSVEPMGAA
jgi:hypothetical protein